MGRFYSITIAKQLFCLKIAGLSLLPLFADGLLGQAHAASHRPHTRYTATVRPAGRTSSSDSINVGQTFKIGIVATCSAGADSVTLSVLSGTPDTGGAATTFNPNPVETGATSEMKIATSTSTEAGNYEPTITGYGAVCGQYSDYSFPLAVNPIISLARQDVVTIVATGQPTLGNDSSMGSFAFSTQLLNGDNIASIAFGSNSSATTNPNTAVLTEPSSGGAPTQGGLASYTVNYTTAGLMATNDKSNPFKAATFGMSCYDTALESDYGTPPSNCKGGGTTIQNPYGFPGLYCKAFITDVKLQGSGVLNNGTKIHYDANTKLITTETQIVGSDNTPVVAGQTVARDRGPFKNPEKCCPNCTTIIPDHNVPMDIHDIGSNIKANDRGCRIGGYRLDLYMGIGKKTCKPFTNPMAVATCQPEQKDAGQVTCPGSALQ